MLIQLTDIAKKEIKRIMSEGDETYLRVKVIGSGCSGFKNKLSFDPDYSQEKDILEEHDGIKVVVDKRSSLYLDGTTIDYADDLNVRGFVFLNDNVKSRCGCKESYSM